MRTKLHGVHTLGPRTLALVGVVVAIVGPTAGAASARTADPPPASLTSTPPSHTTSTSAVLTWNSVGGSTFTCQLDSGSSTACTSPVTYTGLTVGSHTFLLSATRKGNITTASASWTIDPVSAPAPPPPPPPPPPTP